MTLDLTNRRFGKLVTTGVVKSEFCRDRKVRFWLCACDCGRETWVRTNALLSGGSTKCFFCDRGTHGKSLDKNSSYRIWANMLSRCRDRGNSGYYLYGARGIKVCKRWLRFENFYSDMGERPSREHSIDRIDSYGDYELRNCRWATAKEQAVNRRTTKLSYDKAARIRVLFGTGKFTVTTIARRYGVSSHAVARVIDNSRWVR